MRAQPGGGTVNFTNAARTNAPETALFQRTTSTAPALALTLSGNGVANQTRIYFDQATTSTFDNGLNGYYLPASHGLDLASDTAPETFSINGLPQLTGATVTVPLRVHAQVAGTYALTVDELANLPAGYSAYLRDGFSNTITNLATTPSVRVSLAPANVASGELPLSGLAAGIYTARATTATGAVVRQ